MQEDNGIKDVIVDEKYPGITFENGCYNLNDSLITPGNLIIRLDAWFIVKKSIEAGWGIKAGLGITCVKALAFKFNLFAGTAIFKTATDEEKIIKCEKLVSGNIAYGTLIETNQKG